MKLVRVNFDLLKTAADSAGEAEKHLNAPADVEKARDAIVNALTALKEMCDAARVLASPKLKGGTD